MQIELFPSVEKDIKELCRIYRRTDPDYDLSPTKQANLLLRGRLGLALEEARKDLKKIRR